MPNMMCYEIELKAVGQKCVKNIEMNDNEQKRINFSVFIVDYSNGC